MELLYNGRKYKIYGRQPLPTKEGNYLYFIQIGEPEERLFKIGTTNRPLQRMLEHCKYYDKKINVLWFSPCYSKYTTLRIEDKMKAWWQEFTSWEYVTNDRFIIPPEVGEITITVKKEYKIAI